MSRHARSTADEFKRPMHGKSTDIFVKSSKAPPRYLYAPKTRDERFYYYGGGNCCESGYDLTKRISMYARIVVGHGSQATFSLLHQLYLISDMEVHFSVRFHIAIGNEAKFIEPYTSWQSAQQIPYKIKTKAEDGLSLVMVGCHRHTVSILWTSTCTLFIPYSEYIPFIYSSIFVASNEASVVQVPPKGAAVGSEFKAAFFHAGMSSSFLAAVSC